MGNFKLNSLDKQFLRHISEFQEQFPENPWNVHEIIAFAQRKNLSLKRKPNRNLVNSCEAAIAFMRRNEPESESETSAEEPEPVLEPNALNETLKGIYSSKNETEIPMSPMKRKQANSGPTESKKPKVNLESKWAPPAANLSSIGGLDEIAQELLQLIGMPLIHPEIFRHLGIDPPRGILLHGPPGTGKTALATAIAGEVKVPFISIAAPVVVSGMSGESEKKIREVFEEAKELAPCILFIDEIDAITPKRETAQREMERRIVAQLLTCMDEDISLEKTDYKPVIIIGATNRPDSLDPALRRAGRFDREITLGVPDEEGRRRIIEKMSEKLKLDGKIDFEQLAKLTPGFVGADLNALMGEAGMIAVTRIFKSLIGTNTEGQMLLDGVENLCLDSDFSISKLLRSVPTTIPPEHLSNLCICFEDFQNAVKKVQPSSKREGFATVPGVTWDDIGALEVVRDELRMAVVEPILHPEYFKAVGIHSSMGVLLYGPPGCGKTLLAKAVANESHCNFLSIKGPELLNKYVGESERAIRQVFSRAQASSPCIIFFDELDALCPTRNGEAESQSASRLVNTLLTEMDGMQDRKSVFVIGATNRPDMIDSAMLRPGRLDKALYVDLPNQLERLSILQALTKMTPLHINVDLNSVAEDERCEGMSGADLASLVREASVTAVRSAFYSNESTANSTEIKVKQEHFMTAFNKVKASVHAKDRKRYELLKVKFGTSA